MENAEEILESLERFTKLKNKEIPRELDDYLGYVAKTGNTVYTWPDIQYFYREKFLNVIKDFHDSLPKIEDLPQCPNVDPFNYENLKATLLDKLDRFSAAPFTIQRLSELLIEPRKHYNRLDKYMRALEKNILVVSTVEPGMKHSESENGDTDLNGDIVYEEILPETEPERETGERKLETVCESKNDTDDNAPLNGAHAEIEKDDKSDESDEKETDDKEPSTESSTDSEDSKSEPLVEITLVKEDEEKNLDIDDDSKVEPSESDEKHEEEVNVESIDATETEVIDSEEKSASLTDEQRQRERKRSESEAELDVELKSSKIRKLDDESETDSSGDTESAASLSLELESTETPDAETSITQKEESVETESEPIKEETVKKFDDDEAPKPAECEIAIEEESSSSPDIVREFDVTEKEKTDDTSPTNNFDIDVVKSPEKMNTEEHSTSVQEPPLEETTEMEGISNVPAEEDVMDIDEASTQSDSMDI